MITKKECREWIKRLRSGKYRQGTGSLIQKTDRIRHCCLGVLGCQLGYTPEKEVGFDKSVFYYGHLISKNNKTITGRLPTNVLPGRFQDSLIDMNDDVDKKFNFSKIAKWIEDKILPKCK